MRVFFLNIPFHDRFTRESRSPGVAPSGTLYYPIYLALAAGLVRQHGHTIDFLDAPAEHYDLVRTEERVARFEPDLIVATTVTASVFHDIKVMDRLSKKTGAATMLVGTHPTARPLETLKMSPSLDFVVVGEYDFTVLEVAQHLGEGKKREEFSSVKGLAFRLGEQWILNERRAWHENLDEIPWASLIYRDFLRIEHYSYGAQLHPEVTIVSGRGCPYECTFCVFPQTITGQRYRPRSVNDVVDEMEFIQKTWPHNKEIMFEDDTLTVDKERVRRLSEEILRRGLKVTWSGNARADFDDVALLKLMKQAGCRLFCVGFESADQTILDQMRKGGASVKMRERFVKACAEAGIMIHGCFLFGGANETHETMRQTLDMAKQMKLDTAQFFPIMVYPGTRAYEEAKDKGELDSENYDQWLQGSGYYASQIHRGALTGEAISKFTDLAYREFYLRPSFILQKVWQFLFSPSERSRIIFGCHFFMKKIFTREKA
ncbi:MAG: radical SAM protein [Candidatus Omnitrophota bacterium]